MELAGKSDERKREKEIGLPLLPSPLLTSFSELNTRMVAGGKWGEKEGRRKKLDINLQQ